MDSNNNAPAKVDVYQIVTNRIIELLEQGTIPWQKPWTDAGIPMNLLSKRPYRGINLWLLLSLNYERNLFLTWDQLKKIGGSVKKDEHGHVVVFWRTVPKKNETENEETQKSVPLLRYYKVFNVEQCRDLPANIIEPLPKRDTDPILECEAIIKNMPQAPVIKHKEQKAFYDPTNDYINMPRKKSFQTMESYYATLFHELVHSTGHEKRLNRPTLTEMAAFGTVRYSIEELVAELGNAYLCSLTGILHNEIKHSASYIKGWLARLKDDKKFIVQASGHAQKAVDYITNQQQSISEEKEQVEQSEMLNGDQNIKPESIQALIY